MDELIAEGKAPLAEEEAPPAQQEIASDTVFKLEEAPHDWLFPRMAAVVHHAGYGATAAGIRAGVPNIPIPFFVDQFFWAEHVYRIGISPRPIPHKHLTAENLVEAITRVVSDHTLRTRAADLGVRIRAEDGVGNAIQIIQNMLASHDAMY